MAQLGHAPIDNTSLRYAQNTIGQVQHVECRCMSCKGAFQGHVQLDHQLFLFMFTCHLYGFVTHSMFRMFTVSRSCCCGSLWHAFTCVQTQRQSTYTQRSEPYTQGWRSIHLTLVCVGRSNLSDKLRQSVLTCGTAAQLQALRQPPAAHPQQCWLADSLPQHP